MGRIITLISLSLVLILHALTVSAQSMPSQAQIEQFKKLPRAQQEAMAKRFGVDLNSIDVNNLGSPTAASPMDAGAQQADATEPKNQEREFVRTADLKLLSPKQLKERLEYDYDEIQPFGYDLFSHQMSRDYAPLSTTPVPEDYLLGPGDTLRVQLYGKESTYFDLVVDSEGSIVLPELGPLRVSGLTFSEAKKVIGDTIKERKIGVSAAVSMGQLRSIQVFIVGEAQNPGPYVVSALSTISHALLSSGGVSDIASLRNIQVKRAGERVVTFDAYDLLTKGDARNDIRLRSGDVIFIPPREGMVSIHGEISRPAEYEIKGTLNLNELVKLAGGLLPTAYGATVQLKRYSDGKRIVRTIDLAEQGKEVKLQAGDEVYLPPVLNRVSESVMLVGAAARPGYYQWQADMKISDILASVDSALLPITDLNYGLVVRENNDRRLTSVHQFNVIDAINGEQSENINIQPRDMIMLFSRFESAKEEQSRMEQWLRTESDISREQRKKVLQAYQLEYLKKALGAATSKRVLGNQGDAGGEKPDEGGVLARTKERSEEYYSEFSRHRLLQPLMYQLQSQYTEAAASQFVAILGQVQYPGNYPLPANGSALDIIEAAGGLRESAYLARAEVTRTVVEEGIARTRYESFNLKDVISGKVDFKVGGRDRINILAIPDWQNVLEVKLAGEVRFPGTYAIQRGETLKQLLERAGGLTDYAFTNGAVFTREGLREVEASQLANMADQLRQEIASNMVTGNGGALTYADVNKLLQDLTSVEPVGRLVIDLDSVLASAGDSRSSIQLKDGDKLYVPTYQDTVSVIGEVQIPSSHRYKSDLTVSDYVRLAGGSKQKADEDRVYVIRADGSVLMPDKAWFSFDSNRLSAGDTIVVPLDTMYTQNIETWTSVTQIMYQIGVALAAVNNL